MAQPAASAAPQPEASKPASAISPSGDGRVERERDAHEVPAGGPAGGAGEGVRGGVPAPERTLQVVGERRGEHGAEFRPAVRPAPYLRASATACSIEKPSVSPVSVVTCSLGLTISSVGVW